MRVVVGRDAGHLRAERPTHPRHTVKVLHLDERGPALRPDDVVAQLDARLPAAAVLCDRVARVGKGRWLPLAWVRERPDPARHVDHMVLPVPGGAQTLDHVVGHALAEPLDPTRPMWSATLVDGPEPGAQALVLRFHHVIGDGPQVARLLQSLFGPDEPAPAPIVPDPEPVTRRAIVRVGIRRWGELVGRRGELVDAIATARQARRDRDRQPAATDDTAAVFMSPVLPWTRPTPGGRATASISLPLEDVRRVGRRVGGTVNDVVLTMVGGAVRDLVQAEGIVLDRPLTAAGSISRASTVPARGNHHTAVSFPLLVEEHDPARRLARLASTTRKTVERQRHIDRRFEFGVREVSRLFEVLYAIGLFVGRIVDRPSYSLLVTTVRGPSGPLALGARPVTRVVSYGLITEDLGLNVTAWRVGDRLEIGITTRAGTIDPADLASRLTDEFNSLVAATSDQPHGAPR